VIFTLSLSCFAQADLDNASIEKEVLNSFQSLVEASMKLDTKSYFQHFDTSKFIGLNSDGTNWNSFDELTPVIYAGFDSIQKVKSLEFPNAANADTHC
jgi:hypothetical protein